MLLLPNVVHALVNCYNKVLICLLMMLHIAHAIECCHLVMSRLQNVWQAAFDHLFYVSLPRQSSRMPIFLVIPLFVMMNTLTSMLAMSCSQLLVVIFCGC